MDTKNLKEFIEEQIKDGEYDPTVYEDACDILDQVSADEVATDGIVTLTFDGLSTISGSDGGCTVAVSYWSNKLKHFVSLDGDVAVNFESVDDMVKELADFVARARTLEDSISINK